MNVINIQAPIRLDGIRETIDSILESRVTSSFAFASSDPSNTTIGEDNSFSLFVSSSTVIPTGNNLTELTYTQIAGRLEITGLSTNQLPNGRRFWTSFGQLCEDVFFGRIPELVNVSMLLLDQANKKIYHGNTSSNLSGSLPNKTVILEATETKVSTDFFE